MEACRKCKQEITVDEKFVDLLWTPTLGFWGKGKYHLECYEKVKKIGITILVITVIIFLIIFITILAVALKRF